jgi:hypothetical protein
MSTMLTTSQRPSLRAIVIVANGESHRRFCSLTMPSVLAYSERVKADLVFISHDELIPAALSVAASMSKPARVNLPAYLLKLLAVHDALARYERVLLLDSTCFVRETTPDLFQLVPEHAVGGFDEGTLTDFAAAPADRRLAAELRQIDLSVYLNTGVLMLSRAHRAICAPESLLANADLCVGPYADQLYVNTLIVQHAIAVHLLDRSLNYLPIFDYPNPDKRVVTALEAHELELLRREAHIVHCTGYHKHREAILRQIIAALSGPDDRVRSLMRENDHLRLQLSSRTVRAAQWIVAHGRKRLAWLTERRS